MDNSNSTRGLDRRAVDRIFTRLLVRYGAPWLRLWDGLDLNIVKEDWSRELAGMPFDAVVYALEHLPDDKPPPTATAFRKLANGRPEYFQGLPPVKADPARVRAILSGLQVGNSGGSQGWARELRRREEAGERLSLTQKQAWRRALRVGV